MERPILFSAPMVRAILEGRKTQTRRVIKPQPTLPEGFKEYRWFTGLTKSITRGGKTQVFDPPVKNSNLWYCSTEPCEYNELGDGTRIPHSRQADPFQFRCPYGKPGDRLWVREKFRYHFDDELYYCIQYGHDKSVIKPKGLTELQGMQFIDRCEENEGDNLWKPSIHMPRWASRITLEITDIRVERLQDISESDAKAEGAPQCLMDDESKFYERKNGTYKTGFVGLWSHINGPDSWEQNPFVWVIEFKVNKQSEGA